MTSDHDDRTFPLRPIIGVGAVIWHQEKVLLIQRAKEPDIGSWSLPGGAQELGETLVDAVHREVFEETGIEIGAPTLIGTVDLISPRRNGQVQFHYTLIDYVARARTTTLRPGSDASDAHWVAYDEVSKYKLWSKTIDMIDKSRRTLAGA
ncbi:NUDIX hydrolase [Thalassospira sp. MA62]|nr:NUDIX hydrolase [Thalassospira sp. MA62]